MALTYLGNEIWLTDTIGERPTGIPVNAQLIEIPTRRTFHFDGTSWNLPESFIDPGTTWNFYKAGSNYKAQNALLKYVPTTSISTDADVTWDYIYDNFNLAGEETPGAGKVKFGRGTFDFTEEIIADGAIPGGGSSRGVIFEGLESSTLIRFVPTSPKTAGFHIKGVNESIIRNLDIQWNDNCTNGIFLDASTNETSGTLIDNCRIFKTGTLRQSGSVGVLIKQIIDSDFVMHHTTLHKLNIKEAETGIDVTTTLSGAPGDAANTTFMDFDDIILWGNRRGIKLHAQASQNSFRGIKIQAHSTEIDYGISCSGAYNVFDGLTGDVIDEAGTALVILNAGASFNKFINLTESGGNTILDYSGKITNEYLNEAGFLAANIKGRARSGRWYAQSANVALADGLLNGILQAVSGGTIATAFDSTTGPSVTFVPAGAGTHSGLHGTIAIVARQMQPIFYCRFKYSSNTNCRMYIGLTADLTPPAYADLTAGGDAYQAAIACIGVMIPNGSAQNFKVFSGDGTGATVTTDLLDSAGAPLLNNGTDVHELWICGDHASAIPRWLIGLDGHTPMSLTTTADIPAQTTGLTPFAINQFTAASNKTLTLYDMRIRCTT